MRRRAVGIALIVIGLAIVLVSGLADLSGLSTYHGEFGWKQIVGLVVGLGVTVVGVVIAARRPAS